MVLALIHDKTSIEEITLDNNQTIKIWYETDIQHPSPSIYYKITQANKVIVPVTLITTYSMYYDPHYEYDIQVAFARAKTLICVYDLEHWDEGLLILYDTQTGDSWPPRFPIERWRVPYAQLKDENPGLPDLMLDDE